MKVLKKGIINGEVTIQAEDWNEDYHFMPYGSTIACYPKSKVDIEGAFSPKKNEKFRVVFNFKSEEEANDAFDDLILGTKSMADFKENLADKKYEDCI